MLERRILDLGLERARPARRPLPRGRRARGPPRGDRRLRDAVHEPRAELVGRAHVRARSGLRRRLDAVLVRERHALVRRRPLVDFGDSAALGDALCDLIESPSRARRARGRGGADRRDVRLAVDRRGDRGRCFARPSPRRRAGRRSRTPGSSSRMSAPTISSTLVDDCGIVQHANGAIPNRETGYCVDDVARLAVVALELERRTGRPGLGGRPLSRARVPHRCERRGRRRHAQLHELRPPLARRAARRRPCRPRRLGARRRADDRLGSRRSSTRRSDCSRRSCARSTAISRCAPPRTRRSGSPGSTPTGSTTTRGGSSSAVSTQLEAAYDEQRRRRLALVRRRAHATTTRVCRRR